MKSSIKPAIRYTAKIWLGSILVSAITTAVAVRIITPAEDDLPVPILFVLFFVVQLVGAVIPGVVFGWFTSLVIQRPTLVPHKKLTLWLASTFITAVSLGAFVLCTMAPRPASSNLISGIDDLVTLCFVGNVIGLSLLIWLRRLPDVAAPAIN
jgi:hypothetical protein